MNATETIMGGWIITEATDEVWGDVVSPEHKAKWSHKGPRWSKVPRGACVHHFRLLDDDGEVYFYGAAHDDSDFGPLDWARGRYGCTTIQYREKGVWKTL